VTPAVVAEVRDYVLSRLDKELSPKLTYHCLAHTRDDVLPAALKLAKLDSLGEADTMLLELGVLFHDFGFVEQRDGHERIGVRIARTVLPTYGIGDGELDVIEGLIMATKLPQSPRTHLEKLIADADLDVLGRDDFSHINEQLRIELEAAGHHSPLDTWYRNQLAFVERHSYFTPVARTLRDDGKRRNIEALRARIQG
jgi:uncharacterized protein